MFMSNRSEIAVKQITLNENGKYDLPPAIDMTEQFLQAQSPSVLREIIEQHGEGMGTLTPNLYIEKRLKLLQESLEDEDVYLRPEDRTEAQGTLIELELAHNGSNVNKSDFWKLEAAEIENVLKSIDPEKEPEKFREMQRRMHNLEDVAQLYLRQK